MKYAVILILLFVASLCPRTQAGEQTPASAARQALEHLDAQTNLPVDFKRTPVRESVSPPPAISPELAQVMLWAALLVLVAVVLMTVFDNLRPLPATAPKRGKTSPKTAQEIQRRMTAAQGEADSLAADGNYAEAMHTLLLRSLDEMRRRLNVPIAISLTSREILARVKMRPEATTALGDIISRVEISYFGDHAPGVDDYDRCRRSYAALASILKTEGGHE